MPADRCKHFLYNDYMFNASNDDPRIEVARQVFAAWSSGDADAPQCLFTPDAVLDDVASGRFEGWPAIRAFFARGMSRTANLRLDPTEFWANDGGLAVHYVMSGEVLLPETYGAEYVGRRWSVPCMSYLRFAGPLVCFEADFHDKSARAKSLGIG